MPTVAKLANEVTNDGLRLRVFDFDPEPGIALRIYVATIEKEEPKRIELEVVDERGWAEWCESFDIAYSKILPPSTKPNRDKTQFAKRLASLKGSNLALAVIAPRGIGPTKWAEPGTTDKTHIRRRFALLGQTLEGQRISDVYRTTFVITKIPDLEKSELILSGTGLSASIAMYAGVVNPFVKSLKLYDLPTTHANGAILINADKVIHSPQLAIVLIPKITTIIVKNERAKKEWDWVIDFAKRVGTKPPTIHVKE